MEWVDAPPPRMSGKNRHSKWWPVIEQLLANPGKWAIVDNECKHPANSLFMLVRRNKLAIDLRVRRNADDKTYTLYACGRIETNVEEEQV